MDCKPVNTDLAKSFANAVNLYDGLAAGKLLDEVGSKGWSDLVAQARQLTTKTGGAFGGKETTSYMLPEVALERLEDQDSVRLLATHLSQSYSGAIAEVLIPLADSHSKCDK